MSSTEAPPKSVQEFLRQSFSPESFAQRVGEFVDAEAVPEQRAQWKGLLGELPAAKTAERIFYFAKVTEVVREHGMEIELGKFLLVARPTKHSDIKRLIPGVTAASSTPKPPPPLGVETAEKVEGTAARAASVSAPPSPMATASTISQSPPEKAPVAPHGIPVTTTSAVPPPAPPDPPAPTWAVAMIGVAVVILAASLFLGRESHDQSSRILAAFTCVLLGAVGALLGAALSLRLHAPPYGHIILGATGAAVGMVVGVTIWWMPLPPAGETSDTIDAGVRPPISMTVDSGVVNFPRPDAGDGVPTLEPKQIRKCSEELGPIAAGETKTGYLICPHKGSLKFDVVATASPRADCKSGKKPYVEVRVANSRLTKIVARGSGARQTDELKNAPAGKLIVSVKNLDEVGTCPVTTKITAVGSP